MTTGPDRHVFRIVIGCYGHRDSHWSARDELRAIGFEDCQLCSLGSRRALMADGDSDPADAGEHASRRETMRFDLRQVGDLEVHVSSPLLFDRLCPPEHHHEGSLARWMTPTQSHVIWRQLREDCPLLVVSADSAQQQVRSSQVQLRHGPKIVQAFNFAL